MARPLFTQLSEHVYYLPGGVNCAVVVNGGEAVLVDTGGDKDYGRALRKACDALNVTPVAILNTHSHADHYGGNDYLLRQYDVPVYAPAFEAGILQNPYLEPVYLFNGAKPLPELMSKWLLAKPSKVDVVLPQMSTPEPLELVGLTFDLLDTSGHAHRHVSVKVGDVLIAADAVFGRAVLDKYPLPFGQDIGGQIKSAQSLTELGARVLLPGHGKPTEHIEGLVAHNLAAFKRAAAAVEAACLGVSTEEILKEVCKTLDIETLDLPRFFLNRCVVTAYLSYLREAGRVEVTLRDNGLTWHRVLGGSDVS